MIAGPRAVPLRRSAVLAALLAVALLEHLWAASLLDAIDTAGGRAIGELWLSAADRDLIPDR